MPASENNASGRSAFRLSWRAAAAGALGFALIHLQFVVLWRSVYALRPWKGSEWAMTHGLVEPDFSNSPWAFAVCLVGLAVLGLLAALFIRDKLIAVIAGLCCGVFVAVIVTSLTSAEFRSSNLALLAVVLYPSVLFPPLVVGALLGRGASRLGMRGTQHASRS